MRLKLNLKKENRWALRHLIEQITNSKIAWRLPPGGDGRLALTFDDGPIPNTRNILNFLKQHQIKATFFMVAENIIKFPDIAAEVSQAGHMIGSHGFYHKNVANLPLREFSRQVKESFQVVERLAGTQPKIFRPPWGQIKISQAMWLLSHGIHLIFCSQGGIDSRKGILVSDNFPHPNGWTPIILMHDYDKVEQISLILKRQFPHLLRQ